MAVVTVAVTDSAPFDRRWSMPAGEEASLRSPVPRGIITYNGTNAIATLSAGDETNFTLNTAFPTGFVYLLKSAVIRYLSDDLVCNFNNQGFGNYIRSITGNTNTLFNMSSPGEAIIGATQCLKIWVPAPGSPKIFMKAPDAIQFGFADMDAGGSTAGDMTWAIEYYQYDVDQIDKFELNTPIPIIEQTSF